MTGNSSEETKDSSSGAKAALSLEDRLNEAVKFVTHGIAPSNIIDIGELRLPKGSPEAERCKEIQKILEEYAGRTEASRPLSIAVFGPPGSGKSFYVPQITKLIEQQLGIPLVVNLSQFSDPAELSKVFQEALGAEKPRVFFFDEFDSPLSGISLGWLRWFLAPMQDGEVFFEGRSRKIGKAVFVFAGGTAVSLDEFQDRARIDPASRDKKVPDFISRLRGFIDIEGINNLDSGERPLRRALVLRHQLKKRWPDVFKRTAEFPIERRLVESLLSNAHYVHGARSMEAILDMSQLGSQGTFEREGLPHEKLKILHISRGRLDGKMIGISAGQQETEASKFLVELTDKLLQNGATLAYGGDFVAEGTLQSLVEAAKKVPDDLVERAEKERIRNYLGFPSFLNPKVATQHEQSQNQVRFLKLKTLSDSEHNDLGVPADQWFPGRPRNSSEHYNPMHHLAWAVSLFRMRARLIQDIDALIVVGGKDGESWGRFSGIAEEVMLALALGKPIYVLGGRKGATQAAGMLLGFDETLVNQDLCFADTDRIDLRSIHKNFIHAFALPGHPQLPQTIAEVRSYLFDHSITTDSWPWNGLTIDENRELFATEITRSDWGKCVKLIIQGLTRLDWKHSAGPRSSRGLLQASTPKSFAG